LSFPELLDVWRAAASKSETIGNVLIGIAPKAATTEETACSFCKLAIPEEVICPKCQNPVALRPSPVLGCIAKSCFARMWSYLCCPQCDCTWAFEGKPDKDSAAKKPAPAADPLDVDQLYQELDKFVHHVLDIPGASEHLDIRNQISFIYSQKEVLRMAAAESAAHRKAHMEQLAALTQTAKTNQELHKKRAEEAARQSPPLDGDELGMALLRNLGFVR
jgi:hypothetical protein